MYKNRKEIFHLKQESWSEEAVSHPWVLALHHRDHKGILPLKITSDLQQDGVSFSMVSCPVYP